MARSAAWAVLAALSPVPCAALAARPLTNLAALVARANCARFLGHEAWPV
jgi:hypothetical protein